AATARPATRSTTSASPLTNDRPGTRGTIASPPELVRPVHVWCSSRAQEAREAGGTQALSSASRMRRAAAPDRADQRPRGGAEPVLLAGLALGTNMQRARLRAAPWEPLMERPARHPNEHDGSAPRLGASSRDRRISDTGPA